MAPLNAIAFAPVDCRTLAGMTVISGLECLLREPPSVVRDRRLGLVCNPGSIDRRLRLAVDLLAAEDHPGGWRLTHLFAPEHGLRGEYPAGVPVPDSADPITGLPVSSLYGARYTPSAETLGDVDVLVVDLMQVGVRFYTRQVITANCLAAGAEHGRPVVVLDRPNPIAGVTVEGPLLEPGYESIVGRRGQPIRHGLTLGETARAVNESEGIGADLIVVPCTNWQRAHWWDETGLPWVLPSPNIPTLDSATVYPGTCLIEGTILSEGRGTTRPFEIAGAPWIEPYRWAAVLEERGLAGVRFRPLWFQPVAGKHQDARCGGVQLHVTDRQSFRPVATGLHLIETAKCLWPAEFGWRPPGRSGVWPIDRLYGSAALRTRLDAGDDATAIAVSWDTAPFEVLRRRALLYA